MGEKRRHFRLEFAIQDRPVFRSSAGGRYEVIDVAEQGVKISVASRTSKIAPGTKIRGEIRFVDGVSVNVEGQVLRFDDAQNIMVLTLTKGIPMKVMMDQHRKQIKKYRTPAAS